MGHVPVRPSSRPHTSRYCVGEFWLRREESCILSRTLQHSDILVLVRKLGSEHWVLRDPAPLEQIRWRALLRGPAVEARVSQANPSVTQNNPSKWWIGLKTRYQFQKTFPTWEFFINKVSVRYYSWCTSFGDEKHHTSRKAKRPVIFDTVFVFSTYRKATFLNPRYLAVFQWSMIFIFLKVFRTKRLHFIQHYKRSFIFLIKSTIRVSVSPWVLLHYHFHSALEKSWWPNAPGSDLRVLICCSTSCRLYPHTRTSPVIGPTAWVYSEAALRVQQVRRSSKLL